VVLTGKEKAMNNPLIEVQKYGQSIWYDNIRRGLITSGELQHMVENDGLLGVTSNPAIFTAAITGSNDYDQATKALVRQGTGKAIEIYERLAIEDIQLACDVLYPVYLRTKAKDGYISFEVSPYLANDTQGTIEEARRLHKAIGRDNVLIKVPATPAGVPAIQQLISEGISVNVTLLFSVDAYEKVALAYMAGLEQYAAKGGDVTKVASVASFFISRIDSLIDNKITGPKQALDNTADPEKRKKLKSLVGKVAIANAKVAYAKYRELYNTARWKSLAAKGAMPQRLLWASTSTKNEKYPKTLYVDELIGADTVNTVPAETFGEFRKNGRVRESLTENWAENIEQARETMQTLEEVGISMKECTNTLLNDAVQKFSDPFDKLLGAVERKRQELEGGMAKQTYAVGEATAAVQAVLDEWRTAGKVRRLWGGDASLWTGRDEAQWLSWLHIVDGQREQGEHFRQIADDVKSAGFRQALLLGMGGSSLAPEVWKRTFGTVEGFPELLVLDSTVPAQVRAVEKKIDPAKTVFIVASKSGGTIEPNVFKQYFMDRVRKAVGTSKAGSHFIAITDPKTKMHQVAKDEHFRHIFFGLPGIGGRFSALSNFGMVPAAIMGADVPTFLDHTEIMLHACASCVPPELNPGVVLGAILGTLARQGRDKVTLVTSPGIASLGAWLEQLLAESTGKEGKGLIPVDGERVGAPGVYGNDRVFVYERLTSHPSADQDAAVTALEKAGHPVVRIALSSPMDLGQEMFRWEIATAVVGSILGINAFSQPDVEAAKVAARTLTTAYEKEGKLPAQSPIIKESGVSLFADPRNADALATAARSRTAADYLAAHLARIKPGDYFAINAYVEMNDANDKELQMMRHAARDGKRVATTLGYGPRFLHSTGQLHKGGPNSGVFLQITAEDAEDLPIPGQKFTFGILKQAQAQGDFEVVAERGRRLLRVHLGPDVRDGLARLNEMVQKAVSNR
jgi:transaldolase/glucose-6-phosphate isomerase